MKSSIKSALATTVLAGMFALAMASSAQAGSTSCSNATLNGNYGATITGFIAGLPFAELDYVTANGKGSFSGTGTNSYNGVVTTNITITATYTINSNCTGSVTFTNGSGLTQNLVIKSDGSEVQFIGTNSGEAQVTGLARKVSD